MAYYVWIGWFGEVTTHRHGAQTVAVTARWHLTILCRDRARAPAVATVQTLTDMGNQRVRTLGELSIAGPPFGRPDTNPTLTRPSTLYMLPPGHMGKSRH